MDNLSESHESSKSSLPSQLNEIEDFPIILVAQPNQKNDNYLEQEVAKLSRSMTILNTKLRRHVKRNNSITDVKSLLKAQDHVCASFVQVKQRLSLQLKDVKESLVQQFPKNEEVTSLFSKNNINPKITKEDFIKLYKEVEAKSSETIFLWILNRWYFLEGSPVYIPTTFCKLLLDWTNDLNQSMTDLKHPWKSFSQKLNVLVTVQIAPLVNELSLDPESLIAANAYRKGKKNAILDDDLYNQVWIGAFIFHEKNDAEYSPGTWKDIDKCQQICKIQNRMFERISWNNGGLESSPLNINAPKSNVQGNYLVPCRICDNLIPFSTFKDHNSWCAERENQENLAITLMKEIKNMLYLDEYKNNQDIFSLLEQCVNDFEENIDPLQIVSYLKTRLETQVKDPTVEKLESLLLPFKPAPLKDSSINSNKPSSARKMTALRKMTTIEDFKITKMISRGAYGRVFLANKRSTGDYYAIKVLQKSEMLLRNQLQHVVQEKSILSVVDNPFVVKLFFSFESTNNIFLVMEYINGGDLYSLLRNVGVIDEDWARIYMAELIQALSYIHSKGIIHRDLKPENILIANDGHIRLTDFGLSKVGMMDIATQWSLKAKAMESESPKLLMGTPDYVAPEAIRTRIDSPMMDYWSVGVILYESLVGIPPFHAPTPMQVFEKILARDLTFPSNLSAQAQDLIDNLLAVNPDRRLNESSAKNHPFFASIQHWDQLMNQPAVFVPQINNANDTNYFVVKDAEKLLTEDADDFLISERSDSESVASSCSFEFSKAMSTSDMTSKPHSSHKSIVHSVSAFLHKNVGFLQSANQQVLLKGSNSRPESANSTPRPSYSQKGRVIIVTSNQLFSLVLTNLLKPLFLKVSVITEAKNLIEFLTNQREDDDIDNNNVFLLDASLEDMSVDDLARYLRFETQSSFPYSNIWIFSLFEEEVRDYMKQTEKRACLLGEQMIKLETTSIPIIFTEHV